MDAKIDLISPQGNHTTGEGDAARGGQQVGITVGAVIDRNYLEGLVREREALGTGPGMDFTRRLLNQEIERVQNGGKLARSDDRKMSDVTKDKSIKLTVRALVPVKDHPKFNFVGKLLGPKGNSLKRLQEETMTKMAILGRGSMREKEKEEELRLSGDAKFNHLSEDLHVEITAVAPPAEAHARIAYALTEIRRYLVPDYNDEIRQEQMREMQILNKNTPGDSPSEQMDASPGGLSNKGDPMSGSDEDTSSPRSNGEHHQLASPGESPVEKRISDAAPTVVPQGSTPHPAFRGVNRPQTMASGANKKGNNKQSRALRGPAGSRRSVLSLLTKARAIQQKEQDFMGVFRDIAAGYSIYEHLSDLPITETEDITVQNRTGNGLKMKNNPSDRGRFRHDPYPRIASST